MRNSTRTWSELYPDVQLVAEPRESEKSMKPVYSRQSRYIWKKHTSQALELLAEPQCVYYKFYPWGRIQKLGQARKRGVCERLQGNSGTYKEPQHDESKEQKQFLRLVGSGEDSVGPQGTERSEALGEDSGWVQETHA